MNKHYQNAAQRLHKFATEGVDSTEAELRAELEADGVNVTGFLARLVKQAGIQSSVATNKKLSASERLRVLASRAGSKMKGLLGELNPDNAAGSPAAAYGRSGQGGKGTRGSSRRKNRGQTND